MATGINQVTIGAAMSQKPNDDYVLFPQVKHPQGRDRMFTDQWKAMVRSMVEELENPVVAYAIEKTDRMVTEETLKLLSPEAVQEWHDACDEFEVMSEEEQDAWIDKVIATYPKMDNLPDPDGYNEIH